MVGFEKHVNEMRETREVTEKGKRDHLEVFKETT